MKKLLAVFLSLAILTQSLVNVGITVYYHLNKNYIAQKLCENKNNPAIHCNGHCYLVKQLKKAEENEQQQSAQLIKEKEEIITNQYEQLPDKIFQALTPIIFPLEQSSLYISDFRNSLLKPPCCPV